MSNAVDTLSKSVMEILKYSLEPIFYEVFKWVLLVWRRNPEDLTEEGRYQLDLRFEYPPLLRQAQKLSQKRYHIFEMKHTKVSGTKAIRAWFWEDKRNGLECFE